MIDLIFVSERYWNNRSTYLQNIGILLRYFSHYPHVRPKVTMFRPNKTSWTSVIHFPQDLPKSFYQICIFVRYGRYQKVIGGKPILWKTYFEQKLNVKALHKEGYDEELSSEKVFTTCRSAWDSRQAVDLSNNSCIKQISSLPI